MMISLRITDCFSAKSESCLLFAHKDWPVCIHHHLRQLSSQSLLVRCYQSFGGIRHIDH